MILHDVSLIKKAVNEVFEDLKTKYQLTNYDMYSEGFSDSYIGFRKGNVIFSFFMDPKIEFEFSLYEFGASYDQRLAMVNLTNTIYPIFSEEEGVYLKEIRNKSEEFDNYSLDYYKSLIKSQVLFIEKYFPEILSQGILPSV